MQNRKTRKDRHGRRKREQEPQHGVSMVMQAMTVGRTKKEGKQLQGRKSGTCRRKTGIPRERECAMATAPHNLISPLFKIAISPPPPSASRRSAGTGKLYATDLHQLQEANLSVEALRNSRISFCTIHRVDTFIF